MVKVCNQQAYLELFLLAVHQQGFYLLLLALQVLSNNGKIHPDFVMLVGLVIVRNGQEDVLFFSHLRFAPLVMGCCLPCHFDASAFSAVTQRFSARRT